MSLSTKLFYRDIFITPILICILHSYCVISARLLHFTFELPVSGSKKCVSKLRFSNISFVYRARFYNLSTYQTWKIVFGGVIISNHPATAFHDVCLYKNIICLNLSMNETEPRQVYFESHILVFPFLLNASVAQNGPISMQLLWCVILIVLI